MANDPAFLFYPGDYLRDTQCLSEAAQVAYDRIMCEHMRNICITQAQLDFFTKRLTSDQKSEIVMILRPAGNGFCIPWVVDSITKRREYSESRRKNRKSNPDKPKKISQSYVPHMDNENEIVNAIEIDKEIEQWKFWGNEIIIGNDFGWSNMRGRPITQDELNAFLSVATRNEWKMDTQQSFRTALHGFKVNGHKGNLPAQVQKVKLNDL